MATRIVLGLGNPGPEYDDTRHNVGFVVVDRLAGRLGLTFWPDRRALVARAERGEDTWVLAKPTTFMNLSGRAARDLVDACEDEPELVVVCDDFHLDLGRLRFRRKGSAGGQNGLDSILELLGTREVPRLRLGIGDPGRVPWPDYVLKRFKRGEQEAAEEMVQRAADHLEDWLGHGDWDRLQNAANAPAA